MAQAVYQEYLRWVWKIITWILVKKMPGCSISL